MAAVTVVTALQLDTLGRYKVLTYTLTIATTNTLDVPLNSVQGVYFGSPDHLVTDFTTASLSTGGTRITFTGSATAVPILVLGT